MPQRASKSALTSDCQPQLPASKQASKQTDQDCGIFTVTVPDESWPHCLGIQLEARCAYATLDMYEMVVVKAQPRRYSRSCR